MGCKNECVQHLFNDDDVIRSKSQGYDNRNESENQFKAPLDRNMDDIRLMREEAIKYINMYRSQHNAIDLMPNDELNEMAQTNAEEIAETNNMAQSNSKYRGVILGENLFGSAKEVSAKEIIDQWYNDSQYYNYDTNPNKGNYFTQLIWKNTRMVGLGFAKSNNGWGYCVGDFYPPGNIDDQYAVNVIPGDTYTKSKAKGNHLANASHHSVSPSELSMQFAEEAFIAHNRYRKAHKVPPLKWNTDLCQIAQRYAEEMASQDVLQQSNNQYRGEELGESLYMCQGKQISGKEVTDTWYNEKDYDFQKGEFNSNAGHFTQLVWKSSTDVGFGCAQSTSGIYYGVANYYPPGNYEDIFLDNVFPSNDD